MFFKLFEAGGFVFTRAETVDSGRIALDDFGEKGCAFSVRGRKGLEDGGEVFIFVVKEWDFDIVDVIDA